MNQKTEQLLRQAFGRLDLVALGVAVGTLLGAGIGGATAVLLVKGGPHVGRNLALLNQYLPGYTVSWPGAGLGLIEGFLVGFAIGWLLAGVHNVVVRLYVLVLKMKSAAAAGRSFFDNY